MYMCIIYQNVCEIFYNKNKFFQLPRDIGNYRIAIVLIHVVSYILNITEIKNLKINVIYFIQT